MAIRLKEESGDGTGTGDEASGAEGGGSAGVLHWGGWVAESLVSESSGWAVFRWLNLRLAAGWGGSATGGAVASWLVDGGRWLVVATVVAAVATLVVVTLGWGRWVWHWGNWDGLGLDLGLDEELAWSDIDAGTGNAYGNDLSWLVVHNDGGGLNDSDGGDLSSVGAGGLGVATVVASVVAAVVATGVNWSSWVDNDGLATVVDRGGWLVDNNWGGWLVDDLGLGVVGGHWLGVDRVDWGLRWLGHNRVDRGDWLVSWRSVAWRSNNGGHKGGGDE
jgi:hypothetical protein